jgi:hypothetical protein
MVPRLENHRVTRANTERNSGAGRRWCSASGIVATAAVALLACHKPDPPNSDGLTPTEAKEVVAKLPSKTITLGEFARHMAELPPFWATQYQRPERRAELLHKMVRLELLSEEAQRRGHGHEPEVQRVGERAMVEQMMKDLFDTHGLKLSDIQQADIQVYYDEHQQDFSQPVTVRASQIVVKELDTATKILATLKSGPIDAQRFRALAQQYGVEDSQQDLGFFAESPAKGDEHQVPDAVRKAAFSLNSVGELYPQPIATPEGFRLLLLTDQREAVARSLDSASALIRNLLWRQKRQAAIAQFTAELRQRAHMVEDLALLSQVQVDTAPALNAP